MDSNDNNTAIPSREHAESDAPKPEPSKALLIRITDQGNNEMSFKVKPTTILKKAMDMYAEERQLARQSLRFMFDGERVVNESTPADFHMEDGALIEVFMEQIGGAQ